MSLLIFAAVTAGVAVAGYGWWRGVRRPKQSPASVHGVLGSGALAPERNTRGASHSPHAGVIQPGAIVSIRGQDYWLQDGYCVMEGHQSVLAIYLSDAAACVVVSGVEPEWYLGQRAELASSPHLPQSVSLAPGEFQLVKRLPIEARAFGSCDGGGPGLLAMYQGTSSQVLWVLESEAGRGAWLTEPVAEHEVFLWGPVTH